MSEPRERLRDAIAGERRDWHVVEVRPDDLAAVLDSPPDGWAWQCAGCHRPVPPMGMCETCGVFGIMRTAEPAHTLDLDSLRAMFYPQRSGPRTDFDRGVDAVLAAIEHTTAPPTTLDLDSPETVERLVNAVHTARIGEPSHGHPDGLHVSCNDLVAAILAALREQDTPPAAPLDVADGIQLPETHQEGDLP